jgi:hypothetical protein
MLCIHLELFIGKELGSQISLRRSVHILSSQVNLRGFGILRFEVILWLLGIL